MAITASKVPIGTATPIAAFDPVDKSCDGKAELVGHAPELDAVFVAVMRVTPLI